METGEWLTRETLRVLVKPVFGAACITSLALSENPHLDYVMDALATLDAAMKELFGDEYEALKAEVPTSPDFSKEIFTLAPPGE